MPVVQFDVDAMERINCVRRGTNDIDNAAAQLDERRVQLLLVKFLLGSGTFKRTKFLYVIYIGPKCNIVKRGQCLEQLGNFVNKYLKGIAGLTTTDRASISFELLVSHFKKIFIADDGEFSIAKARQEHLQRLKEEQSKMHQEKEYEEKRAKLKSIQVGRARRIKREKDALKKDVNQDPNDPIDNEKNVIAAIRKTDNPLNWAVFSPDPEKLQTVAYGCGGIFELVKILAEDKWYFGLFSISFSNSQQCERRLIFFQWIGNKVKLVRHQRSPAIYPTMRKLLSPYSHEIYIVGQADLVPAEIIKKCKNAFPEQENEPGNAPNKPTNIVLDEKNYIDTLLEEQGRVFLEDNEFQTQGKHAGIRANVTGFDEMHVTTMNGLPDNCTELYDTEDTLRLIMSSEGTLVWAIFEVV